MSKNNDKNKSLEKLDAQIAKLSKKESDDKTPIIKKKDLVRKVKAKEIDDEIEKNKNSTKITKSKRINANIKIKDEKDLKVKKKSTTKKKTTTKKNNTKSVKKVKKITEDNIIVDENKDNITETITNKEIEKLENSLREIYEQEYTIRDNPNNNFFVNDFIANIEERFNKISDKVNEKANKAIDKVADLNEKPINTRSEKLKNLDIITIITWFLTIVFVLSLVFLICFIIWILTY